MGFSNLCLVNPPNFLGDEARWMAHASEDVLENAGSSTEEMFNHMVFNMVIIFSQKSVIVHFASFFSLKKHHLIKMLTQ